MNKSVSKTACVDVYVGDEVTEQVTREQAREMKAAGTHYFINHGKDLRLSKPLCEELKTEIEMILGWNILPEMRNMALNRGRVGQFSYPIPYVFEGHLKKPKASEVNFVPCSSAQ